VLISRPVVGVRRAHHPGRAGNGAAPVTPRVGRKPGHGRPGNGQNGQLGSDQNGSPRPSADCQDQCFEASAQCETHCGPNPKWGQECISQQEAWLEACLIDRRHRADEPGGGAARNQGLAQEGCRCWSPPWCRRREAPS
jgi:hypothetical protein